MRLKEDSNNWRARAIKKRDFKHDHSEPRINFRSQKDTNKWCRGKMGIQHDIAWSNKKDLFGDKYKIGKCLNCDKTMYGKV